MPAQQSLNTHLSQSTFVSVKITLLDKHADNAPLAFMVPNANLVQEILQICKSVGRMASVMTGFMEVGIAFVKILILIQNIIVNM